MNCINISGKRNDTVALLGSRHRNRVILLACALFVLALPAFDWVGAGGTGMGNGQAQCRETFQVSTGMTQDVGIPASGVSKTGMKALKPGDPPARENSASHPALRALSDGTRVVPLLFCRTLRVRPIRIIGEPIGGSIGCRAPPASRI